MTTDLKNRWWLDATLITTGTLRLASGEIREEDARVRPEPGADWPRVAAHAGDATGRPWLPGAGLRGALRAWLDARLPGNDSIRDLFGPPAGKAETAPAGQLAVFGARYLDSRDVAAAVKDSRYWDEGRATVVEPGVAIDRVFGSAAEKKLYFHEVVPAGSRFQLELSVNGADTAAIALLLAALEALGQGEIALGADSQNGRGRLKLEGEWRLRLADPAAQQTWLQARLIGGSNQPLTDFAPIQRLTAAPLTPATPPARLAIRLDFDSLFLVHDPGRLVAEGDQNGRAKSANFMPRLDERGRPLLPATSFRGVLRSRMEKIGRTLGWPVCGEGTGVACRPVREFEQVAQLCPVCAVMGATGWESLLTISDFTAASPADAGQVMVQEFVAIDRFTGGGSDGAKFNAQGYYRPSLKGGLNLDTVRLAHLRAHPDQQTSHQADRGLGLLDLALRDLAEGDLRFGAGSGKGHGRLRGAELGPDAQWQAALKPAQIQPLPYNPAPAWKSVPAATFTPPAPATGAAQANEFLNPYQFLAPPSHLPNPQGKGQLPPGWCDLNQTQADQLGNAGHHRFSNQAGGEPVYSGRIICQLTPETPLFVGAQRHPGEPATAEHFTLDGRPALPASSLRGLIASLLEAATGSAMRVLEDRHLSYRKTTAEALSALGMVVYVKNPNTGKPEYRIRPITLATKDWNGRDWGDKPTGNYPELMGNPARLKLYVDGYQNQPGYTKETPNYRYVRLDSRLAWEGDGFANENALRYPSRDTQRRFAIGQKGNGRDTLRPTDVSSTPTEAHVRAILRIMHAPGRDMPPGARHDLLLPWPEAWEKTSPLAIHPHALERFNTLADERTEESVRRQGGQVSDLEVLPYHPVGSKRNTQPDKLEKRLRLKTGDLVYYRPDADGIVEEISFSAIWRGRVEEETTEDGQPVIKAATVRRFFENISPELLPFNRQRRFLSPAELLFGYASDDKKQDRKEDWGGAYAGRVSFGDALSKDALQGDAVILKILDAPKPPSPAFYFRPRQTGGANTKADLKPVSHLSNGRKFYLHQSQTDEPWRSRHPDQNPKQKVRIAPVVAGSFVFHVDFDNLSAWELGALCHALRPEQSFRHKLGLGKPLGLGTVRIDPLGVFLIDRPRRYAAGEAERYHWVWRAENAAALAPWQDRYPREATASALAASPSFDQLREKFRAGMDARLRRSLAILGDPAQVGHTPVHYPLDVGQADTELEHYRWFVQNSQPNQVKPQTLHPVDGSLPKLRKNTDCAQH